MKRRLSLLRLGLPSRAALAFVLPRSRRHKPVFVTVRRGMDELRAMVVGVEPGQAGGPSHLLAGRHLARNHQQAVVDVRTGFGSGQRIRIRRHGYAVVGLTQRMVSSSGDSMVIIALTDAQFLKDNDTT